MGAPVAVVTAGAALAGAAVGAVSKYRAGQFNAQVARNNAQLAEWQRSDALQRGAFAAGAVRARGSAAAAAARARMASSGVDPTVGSAANVLAGQQVAIEQDVAMVQANALREAWGYENQAQDYRARSRMAREAGILGAIGTGVGGVGSAISAYGSVRR